VGWNLGSILVNRMGYCSGPLNGWDFQYYIGESGGYSRTPLNGRYCLYDIGESCWVFKWPTEMGDIFGAMLVNQLGQLRGPLQWVRVSMQYW
jgi:hypothetical protein